MVPLPQPSQCNLSPTATRWDDIGSCSSRTAGQDSLRLEAKSISQRRESSHDPETRSLRTCYRGRAGRGAVLAGGSQGQGEGGLHRLPHRWHGRERYWRPQFGGTCGQAAQCRPEVKIWIRPRRARRRMQTERGGAGGDQGGSRPLHRRVRVALLLGGGDRGRAYIPPARAASCARWSCPAPTSPTATNIPKCIGSMGR